MGDANRNQACTDRLQVGGREAATDGDDDRDLLHAATEMHERGDKVCYGDCLPGSCVCDD